MILWIRYPDNGISALPYLKCNQMQDFEQHCIHLLIKIHLLTSRNFPKLVQWVFRAVPLEQRHSRVQEHLFRIYEKLNPHQKHIITYKGQSHQKTLPLVWIIPTFWPLCITYNICFFITVLLQPLHDSYSTKSPSLKTHQSFSSLLLYSA